MQTMTPRAICVCLFSLSLGVVVGLDRGRRIWGRRAGLAQRGREDATVRSDASPVMRDSALPHPLHPPPSRHAVEAPPPHPSRSRSEREKERRGSPLCGEECGGGAVAEEKETRGMTEEDEERWRRRKTRSSDGSDVLSIWGRETKRETRGWGK